MVKRLRENCLASMRYGIYAYLSWLVLLDIYKLENDVDIWLKVKK